MEREGEANFPPDLPEQIEIELLRLTSLRQEITETVTAFGMGLNTLMKGGRS